jgi:spermidine/putrescine transport system substrate-binding protein
MFHPRYSRRQVLAGAAAATAAASLGAPRRARAGDEINALVWCDHSDPNLLNPFEEANGIKVNTKEFGATGEALAVLEQSKPGDWDVLVLDTVDIPRLAAKGYLAELDDADYPMADIFPEVQSPEFNKPGGKTHGVTEKFGYNCFSYNNTKVDPADMRKSEVMWNGKYAGRLAIYDYYNPIIAMVAIGIGIKPSELKQDHIPAIKEKLLAMKKQSALVGDVTTVQNALVGGRHRRRRRICGGRADGRETGTGLGAARRRRCSLDAVARHLQGLHPSGIGQEIRAIRAGPGGPGAARHLGLLLGDAVEQDGGAQRCPEENPALG